MFRLSMMPDEETRKDLMSFIKGLLREAVPAAIAEKMNEDGWLESRFAAAIEKLDLRRAAFAWLQSASTWESREAQRAIDARVEIHRQQWMGSVLGAINERVDGIFRNADRNMAVILEKANAKIDQITEGRVRAIVVEELRRRLGN